MSTRRLCRTFHCKLCGRQARICSACDRGNVYCSRSCARVARRDQCRRAGKRYRETEAGREGNARRQRESYERKRAGLCAEISEKNRADLTHQGSEGRGCGVIMPGVVAAATVSAEIESRDIQAALEPVGVDCPDSKQLRSCDFCGRPCCYSSPVNTEESKHGFQETDPPSSTPPPPSG